MKLARCAAALAAALAVTADVRADGPTTPWVDEAEVPLPAWARSVVAKPGERGEAGDMTLFAGPSRASGRRGVTAPGAVLPLYGAKRGSGCDGKWWLVGPLAWTCSDGALLSAGEPIAAALLSGADGLPHDYFFVHGEGTSAYASLDAAAEGTPDRELEGGWAVAIVEQRAAGGDRWGRTSKGLWVSMQDLAPARPSLFHGEAADRGVLDFAWVAADRALLVAGPSARAKVRGSLPRFQLVHVLGESGDRVRVAEDRWIAVRDLARPELSPPPAEVAPGERWIDVDLASETLVAYEGARPVYATLVSTGRGGPGTDSATPLGVHRIWVKLLASDMDDVERDDVQAHYSLEDVPWVQFFDQAVALHGTYWHRDFGRPKSHGCVNLSPIDARWLFDFTSPRLPPGWTAAYPTAFDPGTPVRIR